MQVPVEDKAIEYNCQEDINDNAEDEWEKFMGECEEHKERTKSVIDAVNEQRARGGSIEEGDPNTDIPCADLSIDSSPEDEGETLWGLFITDLNSHSIEKLTSTVQVTRLVRGRLKLTRRNYRILDRTNPSAISKKNESPMISSSQNNSINISPLRALWLLPLPNN